MFVLFVFVLCHFTLSHCLIVSHTVSHIVSHCLIFFNTASHSVSSCRSQCIHRLCTMNSSLDVWCLRGPLSSSVSVCFIRQVKRCHVLRSAVLHIIRTVCEIQLMCCYWDGHTSTRVSWQPTDRVRTETRSWLHWFYTGFYRNVCILLHVYELYVCIFL